MTWNVYHICGFCKIVNSKLCMMIFCITHVRFDASLLCLLCLLLGVEAVTDNDETLLLAQSVFRHGQRSPTHTFKNDLYKEDSWPQGFGQLTQEGMRQEFDLGQLFKRRYIDTGFLSERYNRSEVYMRSTDKDRTLMSAYCVLAGLYPPNGTQKWDPDLRWQPIPVHTVPLTEDYMLGSGSACPKLDELQKQFMQSAMMKKFVRENQNIIKMFANYSGENATVEGLIKILDPLYVEKMLNRTIPAWAESHWEIILELLDKEAELKFPEPEMAKLKGGVLLNTLIENMELIINKTSQTPKANFYSGHDTTIIGLMKNMRIFNDKMVPLSAAVILELYRSKDAYEVRIMYKNETISNDTIELKIPGCELSCPFSKFKSLLSNATISDGRAACFSVTPTPSSPQKDGKIAVIVLGCLVGLLFAVLVIIFALYFRRRKTPQDYSLVGTMDDDDME